LLKVSQVFWSFDMHGKALLLGSVSSLATMAVAMNGAHGQTMPVDTTPTGFTYSVQGGALFSTPSSAIADKAGQKTGNPSPGTTTTASLPPEDIGYNAAFSVGKQIDAGWDLAFGGSVNHMQDNSGSILTSFSAGGSHGSAATTMATQFAFETGDFEVGYSPQLDPGYKVRLSGGVRALHLVDGNAASGIVDKTGNSGSGYGYGYASAQTTADFLGAGPRVAISGSKRVDGSAFGISGAVGVAAEYGRETQDKTGSGGSYTSSGGSGSASTNQTFPTTKKGTASYKWIFDLDASIGADYYLNDNTTLTVGYHAEQLTNVDGSNFNANGMKSKLVSGPFLKLSGSL
jgi:hypothetical protein